MLTLVFDFETTGLSLHPAAKLNLQPRAIEFGGVIIRPDGEIIREISYLIDPEQLIDEVITKVTGLTNDDLRGKPKFTQVYPEIREAFEMVDVSAAHNHPFDKDILSFELARLGVTDFPFAKFELCTVQTYAGEWGKRPKLTQLYEAVIGRKLEQTHRALDDCKALAEIVVADRLLEMFN